LTLAEKIQADPAQVPPLSADVSVIDPRTDPHCRVRNDAGRSRCFSPTLRPRERLESSAGRAQTLKTLIAVRMAMDAPTKYREPRRGPYPTSPVAAARTREAATSADIVSP
jgi:hypothetical protein